MRGVRLYPRLRYWTGDQQIEPMPADLPARAARAHARLWVVLSHKNPAWKPVVLTPLGRFYDDVATEHVGDEIEVHELHVRPDFSRGAASEISTRASAR